MSDGRVVISSEPGLNPDDVAQRTFATAFRGYDQQEVRLFLKRVRDELAAARERELELRHWLEEERRRAAHPEVDEPTLMRVLGEEAARVLSTAKEAAADIRSNAEENVARMLREAEERAAAMRSEAEADAARVRGEAEGLLSARTEDAERAAAAIRQAAEAEAAAVIAQARAEAEAEVELARSRGREMVNEAQALRERVLADLVRRRNQAKVQVEQLRAGRERLLEAYKLVRRTLDEATTELTTAEAEARTAADLAGRRATNDLGSEAAELATVEAELAALEATRPAVSEPPPSPPAPPAFDPEPPPAPRFNPDPVPTPVADVAPAPAPAPPPPDPEPVPTPAVADATPAPIDAEEGFRVLSPSEDPDPADAAPVRSVDDLFARIKADRAGAVAKAEQVLATAPKPDGDVEPAPDADAEMEADVDEDESLRQRRDAVLEPLEATLVRKLKRALQDEQNELLDALRTHRGKGPATSVLPAHQAQLDRYCQVAAPLLEEAARHGGRFAGGDGSRGGERPAVVAAELADDLVGFLRDRIEQALADEADAVDRLGASYRQCKTQRVDRVARHHLASAFSLGTLAGAANGSALRWVVDDDGGPCPDCDDNALAGPVPVGDEFPTGQRRPPAHAGCRCLLAPAGSVPERQR